MAKPPFRADQVGSLLRRAELKQAREDFKNKKVTREQLTQIENKCIRSAVAMQEAAGMQAVTDGGFRRAFWRVDFLTGFGGLVATQGRYALKLPGEGAPEAATEGLLLVYGKRGPFKPVAGEHFQ